ncbi:MAG: IS1380 family transposase [Patescibacteria group bacterium]
MIRQTVLGFKLEKTGERLTAHGGLAFMAEYSHGLGLKDLVNQHLPLPGSPRGYDPSVFVECLVWMLWGGGRRLEDMRELEREGALMAMLGQEEIPDPDTVGDWMRRMGDPKKGQGGLVGLGCVRDLLNQRILRRDGISEYTLDADATQIVAEKQDAQWTYQSEKGYMPMLGFLFETPVCISDEFREGNVSPGSGQVDFYVGSKGQMPKGKRIARYRADSASYQAELINELEADGVTWAITADQDASVKRLIRQIPEEAWKEPQAGCGYEVAETVHTMNKTEKAFRLIIKREWRQQRGLFEGEEGKYFYHGVASNWLEEEKDSHAVLMWHNQRGSAENFNKELKSGFGMEQMPCGQGYANAVYLRIGVIAYNLFIGFKKLSCPNAWAHHTIATFRWKMVQVAGLIVHRARQVVLKLAVDAEELAIFEGIRRRCFELSVATS